MILKYFQKKIWLLSFVLLVVAVAGIYIFFLADRERKVVSPENTSPNSGKQTYEIIGGGWRNFKITEVEIDPIDVKRGESQKITVLVEEGGANPITFENKVEATAFTDNKSSPFTLLLKKVSDTDQAIITRWEGFWVLEDTNDSIYTINITASGADGEHSVDLSLK